MRKENIWRGEVTFMMDGIKHILRPSFAALQQVEATLGSGLIMIARKLTAGTLGAEEIAVIIAATIQTASGIDMLLIKENMPAVTHAVAQMLVMVFEGMPYA